MTSPSSKLYVSLIILIGLVGGYVLYDYLIRQYEVSVPPVVISNQDNLMSLKDLKVDFNTLDDSAFKGLITSGESPVNPGTTGKKDLFAP